METLEGKRRIELLIDSLGSLIKIESSFLEERKSKGEEKDLYRGTRVFAGWSKKLSGGNTRTLEQTPIESGTSPALRRRCHYLRQPEKESLIRSAIRKGEVGAGRVYSYQRLGFDAITFNREPLRVRRESGLEFLRDSGCERGEQGTVNILKKRNTSTQITDNA